MTIELLGDNCRRCQRLQENIKLALKGYTQNHTFTQVGDPERFVDYSLFSLPALAIDGEVKAAGQILSVQDILEML